ncbi:glycosyltransferase [Salinisphaera sp. P385]|uniref:Glycosyltransferase n=1 Tax=Spectribacter acetivorans TaxID=3075603 RepID=A0ABU3BC70_9GAMM|nr:glycosyltransferase [Salinisphaera sp. P385]MDT0619874.1 glycosyltransferase [Salinisphaera sp. P385]
MARIGIVIYSLAGAGAERVSVNLAHEFVAAGHAVDFVLAQGEGELMGEVPPGSGVHVARSGGARAWRAAIAHYVDTQAPDVLLAMMEGAGVLSLQAARGRSVPVYVVSHIHFSRHCRHASRWKERWLMPLAARWYLRGAAGVIGVSQGVSEDIRRAAGLKREKVHTIYNPILTEDFYRKAAEPVDHPWFEPDRGSLTVVTVGRLTAQKDHDTLLRAISEVNRQRPVRLVVLGQGERREELEALARELGIGEIVEFAGFDPNPYRYIAAADVFALSSRWEGFGNVLVEALACGTGVVSTDCPSGPSEVLGEGEYGELVPVGDSSALARSIVAAASRPAETRGLFQHLERFKAARVAQEYLHVMGLIEGDDS